MNFYTYFREAQNNSEGICIKHYFRDCYQSNDFVLANCWSTHPFLREFDNISFSFIFMTNLQTILLLSFGGTLTLGGMSFLNLVINGMNLGTIFYEA
ncbi:hypothetical protein OCC_01484 [Thermococcus litoralis DSM 5473]|uniref:Uncharacterized protein n=1 Tax=Thermococcus litoralis (strain ATCC 51850 / DSM 5473 / JCM 8560 / NS-C) TaxID=523849 RepID=H3ZLM2_THELN|nr:hypothetical protein OCC_01484 [Thermococcus litoralis DSM 5473]